MDTLSCGDEMVIGLPKALLYYRYSQLWATFFRELDCEILISDDTCKETLVSGAKSTMDENCLPLKVFMGHVCALAGRCDYILVPRFAQIGRNDEFCVRFWGLPDLVKNTFKDAPLLSYNLDSGRRSAERMEFLEMGRALQKGPVNALHAYRTGLDAQQAYDRRKAAEQHKNLNLPGPKILIAAQPYLIHDPYVGGIIQKIIARQGGIPLFSDRCDRALCRVLSKELSGDLFWTLNKETVGAISLYKSQVDGIILLTAFPCGTDSLVGELVMRKVKDIPLIQILLDEHQAQAGLETRIESFMDILRQRRA